MWNYIKSRSENHSSERNLLVVGDNHISVTSLAFSQAYEHACTGEHALVIAAEGTFIPGQLPHLFDVSGFSAT